MLSRWPAFHTFAGKVYGGLRPAVVAERLFGTRVREWEWSGRHRNDAGDWDDSRFPDYWSSYEHRHRVVLADLIAGFTPLSRVLEIGSNCGPNLYGLARRFPDAEFFGVDINSRAIEQGREMFAAEGIGNVHLDRKRADELEHFADGFFDVVFTDAVLIYIGRDKIAGVLREMLRVARKGLVLLERQDFDPEAAGGRRSLGFKYHDLWVRDYAKLIEGMETGAQVSVTRVTGDVWPDRGWQENGAFIEVRLPATETSDE